MKLALKYCFAVAIMSSLLACSSSVKRDESAAPVTIAALAGQKYSAINLYLSGNAKKQLVDNPKFNPDALKGTIQRMLEARSLMAADSTYRIDVEITDINVRSNFSAVMFGFLAGSDRVAGNVYLGNKDGKHLSRYEVAVSYALGGIAGGQDETRMGWLYEEFAKHVVNELPAVDRR